MNAQQVQRVVSPGIADLGLEVEAVEVVPAGRRRVVRVVVDGDGPKGQGPSLDEIADATRAASDALDASDVMGNGPYTLEVSSRGTSRPLTETQHWRRNRTRLVKVTLAGGETLQGRIAASDDDGVTLTIAGAKPKDPDTERVIAFADVTKAVIEVELNRKNNDDENDDLGDEDGEE